MNNSNGIEDSVNERVVVDIHPTANSGESADIAVGLENRCMYIDISLQCYGNHQSHIRINVDNPHQLIELSTALKFVALKSIEFFENNP